MSEQKKEDQQGCFVLNAVLSLIVVVFVKWLFPQVIPFEWFEFWEWKSVSEMLSVILICWPIWTWALLVTSIQVFTNWNTPEQNRNAEFCLGGGLALSVWAGVAEEICFRWIIFYSAIAGVKFVNLLFFGWLGFGIPEFLYNNLIGHIANFFTLGFLEPYLFSEYGWAIGAAIIGTNAFFRDGHKYQGVLGWINSWFLGMAFFYVMFEHGLPAAIFMHFLYNSLIFGLWYLDALVERHIHKNV